MNNMFNKFFILTVFIFLAGCSMSRPHSNLLDCRDIIQDSWAKAEMLKDLNQRFPNYKAAWGSEIGLKFGEGGIRYYPWTIKTSDNSMFSIIYNFSPQNRLCEDIGYQFIKLDHTKIEMSPQIKPR